jgi:hypothetical protein
MTPSTMSTQEIRMPDQATKTNTFPSAVGAALVTLALLPLQAQAHDDHTAAPHSHAVGVDTSAGMTVVRDAATGELRAPTAGEIAAIALRAGHAQSLRAAPTAPLPKVHPSGARGARMTDEFMSTSVAVRKADGSVDMQCFETRQSADAALRAAKFPVAAAATGGGLETE